MKNENAVLISSMDAGDSKYNAKDFAKEQMLELPIYGGVIAMHYNHDMIELNARYKCDFKGFQGCVFDNVDDDGCHTFVVAFSKGSKTKTISHEAFHMSNRIWDKISAKSDFMNDEPQAYLIGWLTEEFEKFLLTTDNYAE